MDELLRWWPVALFAVNAAVGWLAWSARKSFATQEDLGAVKGRLTAVEGAVALIRSDLNHMPSRDDFARLSESIVRLLADQERLTSEIRSAQSSHDRTLAAVTRIEDFLLGHGK